MSTDIPKALQMEASCMTYSKLLIVNSTGQKKTFPFVRASDELNDFAYNMQEWEQHT